MRGSMPTDNTLNPSRDHECEMCRWLEAEHYNKRELSVFKRVEDGYWLIAVQHGTISEDRCRRMVSLYGSTIQGTGVGEYNERGHFFVKHR